MRVNVSITDVRSRVGLGDYTGELRYSQTVRLTDRTSGSATVQDFPFTVVVPCTGTSATDIGSTCAVDTTADAVMPGAVREGVRSIWQLTQAQVFDGGSDGVAATGPNTLLAVQGVFIP